MKYILKSHFTAMTTNIEPFKIQWPKKMFSFQPWPEICSTVWRIWHLIVCSDKSWSNNQFSLLSLIHFLYEWSGESVLKGSGVKGLNLAPILMKDRCLQAKYKKSTKYTHRRFIILCLKDIDSAFSRHFTSYTWFCNRNTIFKIISFLCLSLLWSHRHYAIVYVM